MRAFGFFGGATAQIVSDNLKAGITKACFYDPAINRTYADMAAHYDTAVVPARPQRPHRAAVDPFSRASARHLCSVASEIPSSCDNCQMAMLFGGNIRSSTADFRSSEYPKSSSYPAHLKIRKK